MNKNAKLLLFFLFFIFLSLNIFSDSAIERILSSGKIIVGTSADYPPYEFHLINDKEGELFGIDIDIAHVIGKELGVKVQIKNIIFHKLFSELDSGKVDILIAGLNPTEKRKIYADFSIIYYSALQNMVIRNSEKHQIVYLKDLRGKTVGTQQGSIQSEMAPSRIPGAKFMYFNSIDELITGLKSKLLDAVILEKPVADSYVMRNKDLISHECISSGKLDEPLGSAIAVKKGDLKLLKKINSILIKLIANEKIYEFVENAKILSNKR